MQQEPTVAEHFIRKAVAVRKTYEAILSALRPIGPFEEQAKKTSIHLVRRSAFAGVATKKDSLVLTIKSAERISGDRVHRVEQTSANRWHVEVRLTSPSDVDNELKSWLQAAYDLSR